MRPLLLPLLLASIPPALSAKDLRVLVSGIAPVQGEVRCLLFAGERGFPGREDRAAAVVKYAPAGDLLTCTFPGVAPGRYAVAVLHDVDGNGEFDGDFESGDDEPWGVTNNVRPAGRAPQFVEAVIYVGTLADYEVSLQRP